MSLSSLTSVLLVDIVCNGSSILVTECHMCLQLLIKCDGIELQNVIGLSVKCVTHNILLKAGLDFYLSNNTNINEE